MDLLVSRSGNGRDLCYGPEGGRSCRDYTLSRLYDWRVEDGEMHPVDLDAFSLSRLTWRLQNGYAPVGSVSSLWSLGTLSGSAA